MIFFSVLHPRKVESPNSVIEFPKITEDSFSQFLNVEEPMVSTLSGRMMSVNAIQFSKSLLCPILLIYSFTVMDVRAEHPLKVSSPICSTSLGNIIDDNAVQPLKAFFS